MSADYSFAYLHADMHRYLERQSGKKLPRTASIVIDLAIDKESMVGVKRWIESFMAARRG